MFEKNNQELKTAQRKEVERKLDALGWGLFFIWTGVAILADVGWGVGLIGAGLIVLGVLAVRERMSDSADPNTTKAIC